MRFSNMQKLRDNGLMGLDSIMGNFRSGQSTQRLKRQKAHVGLAKRRHSINTSVKDHNFFQPVAEKLAEMRTHFQLQRRIPK